MSPFSPADRSKLTPYVTSTEGDVFAVKNLEGIVGAVYARYSRAATGFRETLLKEFVEEGHINAAKAGDLIERVLVAYGDDSVGELEGAHVSFENVSILATKEIEDRRIGGSPIEKSTRYVLYDERGPDGNFRYYRDPDVLASEHGPAYIETMDLIFQTYADLVGPMQDYYKKLKPIEIAEYDINGDGAKETLAALKDDADLKAFKRTYNADIRTKACDTLRYLLPIATLTNVGVFGNGRFFQNVLTSLYSADLPEARRLAESAQRELDQIMPRYVKRAKRQEYAVNNRERMKKLAAEMFVGIAPIEEPPVTLVDRGEDAMAAKLGGELAMSADALRGALRDEEDDLLLSCMLYQFTVHPLRQIRDIVRQLKPEQKQRLIEAYVGARQTRRDRPGRAFEAGYPYTFDLATDFGTYKDLMRHRMTTQLRQKFTPLHGFVMPPDLEAAGFANQAKLCSEKAAELYNRLTPDFPEQASYATLHGSKVRFIMGLNDREASHLIELRTTPQGHPSYRKVCQEMHKAIAARSPWRAAVIRFADHNDYFWSRAASEARQRSEERELDKRQGLI
ncbi:MAG: FAD-dependent thymidylate synthase [Patescibacteria group bacterium]